jgi:hypothetical protein
MAQQNTMNQNTGTGSSVGIVVFAGLIMVMVGFFEALEGLAALINDNFFIVGPNYTYNIDVTSWGWTHLLLGLLVFFAGFGVFSGRVWARVTGITLAILSAFANFLFIPYYPVWSILMIALDIVVIWGLSVYRPEEVV